jgi:hypothetical protein
MARNIWSKFSRSSSAAGMFGLGWASTACYCDSEPARDKEVPLRTFVPKVLSPRVTRITERCACRKRAFSGAVPSVGLELGRPSSDIEVRGKGWPAPADSSHLPSARLHFARDVRPRAAMRFSVSPFLQPSLQLCARITGFRAGQARAIRRDEQRRLGAQTHTSGSRAGAVHKCTCA